MPNVPPYWIVHVITDLIAASREAGLSATSSALHAARLIALEELRESEPKLLPPEQTHKTSHPNASCAQVLAFTPKAQPNHKFP